MVNNKLSIIGGFEEYINVTLIVISGHRIIITTVIGIRHVITGIRKIEYHHRHQYQVNTASSPSSTKHINFHVSAFHWRHHQSSRVITNGNVITSRHHQLHQSVIIISHRMNSIVIIIKSPLYINGYCLLNSHTHIASQYISFITCWII